MSTIMELSTREKPQWCPGCGNMGLHMALKAALSELGIPRKDTVVVSGVGCSGKSSHYINSYGFESLHGRSVPVAAGVRLANSNLTVIAEGGDGDGYGIGSAHFLHSFRRNINMTYIVHDNAIYGLTTGQASPMSQKGMKTKSTPHGNIEIPFNQLAIAISAGGSFVARTFVGDLPHMKETFKQAIAHKGFALVDVLQPCVTFNKLNTYAWWQQRVYKLDASHNPSDRTAALAKAFEDTFSNYERIPIGVFYKEERPTYEDQTPQFAAGPLVSQAVKTDAVEKALDEFC
jgi:2-oxoglutarate/2-oxoacid ferredoxin oxidoreductase subunit beta